MIKNKLQLLIATMLVCFSLSACGEPMTEEERAAYEASKTHEYEIVSVYQYIATETNNFGAVTSQKLKYCFTYIGDDGQLHQFDDFEHTEYGLWKVCIGEENKYVVEDGFDTYRWLYLTRETFTNIEMK